jgi:hypothetical protein
MSMRHLSVQITSQYLNEMFHLYNTPRLGSVIRFLAGPVRFLPLQFPTLNSCTLHARM